MQETWVWFLGWEDPLEKEMATHSSILAWRIPWTEKPDRLQGTHLFIWLHWVWVAARRIFVVSCGNFHWGTQTLWLWYESLVAPWHRDISSPTKEWIWVPCIARQILNQWTNREVPVLLYFVAQIFPDLSPIQTDSCVPLLHPIHLYALRYILVKDIIDSNCTSHAPDLESVISTRTPFSGEKEFRYQNLGIRCSLLLVLLMDRAREYIKVPPSHLDFCTHTYIYIKYISSFLHICIPYH